MAKERVTRRQKDISRLLREQKKTGMPKPPAPKRKNKERKMFTMKRMSLLILLATMSLLYSGCAYVNLALLPEPGPLQEKVVDGEGERKILLMDVTGMISEEKRRKLGLREEISMVDEFRESLKKARGDKKIAGFVIRINSPGGTVTASDILHHEILE